PRRAPGAEAVACMVAMPCSEPWNGLTGVVSYSLPWPPSCPPPEPPSPPSRGPEGRRLRLRRPRLDRRVDGSVFFSGPLARGMAMAAGALATVGATTGACTAGAAPGWVWDEPASGAAAPVPGACGAVPTEGSP